MRIEFEDPGETRYSVVKAIAEREFIVDIEMPNGRVFRRVMVTRAEDDGLAFREFPRKPEFAGSFIHYDNIERLVIL